MSNCGAQSDSSSSLCSQASANRSRIERAMLGGVSAAYNNMARLCILEGNYGNASELIQRGLRLVKLDEIKVQYTLLKNLGWLRLLQERYADAREALQKAIELDSQQASVHCLLAQVYEAEKELTEAQKEWACCLHYARDDHPDEDTWIAMAQKRLASPDDLLS